MKKNGRVHLVLYIAGQTPRCIAALNNLKAICKDNLHGNFEIEIIDLLKHPNLARDHQIIAIPTVIRKHPKPIKKATGDLSDKLGVIAGLEIRESHHD